MEELETPTEHIQEEIHHHAAHSQERWVLGVALSSAIIAALAAVAALMASHHSNEAMVDQIKASDQWTYYQSKGIKASVLTTKIEIYEALGKKADQKDRDKVDSYKNDQDQIQEKASELEHESEAHFAHHLNLARAVTLFQVAIAISAISVLTHRRRFWLVGLGFGACGLVFLVTGLI